VLAAVTLGINAGVLLADGLAATLAPLIQQQSLQRA